LPPHSLLRQTHYCNHSVFVSVFVCLSLHIYKHIYIYDQICIYVYICLLDLASTYERKYVTYVLLNLAYFA
jgi:hypothetical protein